MIYLLVFNFLEIMNKVRVKNTELKMKRLVLSAILISIIPMAVYADPIVIKKAKVLRIMTVPDIKGGCSIRTDIDPANVAGLETCKGDFQLDCAADFDTALVAQRKLDLVSLSWAAKRYVYLKVDPDKTSSGFCFVDTVHLF